MNKNVERVRLISVTREGWKGELKMSLSALAEYLLPSEGGECYYNFTGTQKPNLIEGEMLVFRFAGRLLGEGVFVRWLRTNARRMIYRPVQQYRERVEASRFLKN